MNNPSSNLPNFKTSLKFDHLTADERLITLSQQWGSSLVASTSFGLQSSVMLHLISKNVPDLPVIFIDTGYLFPETYHYAEQLTKLLNINLHVYTANYSAARIDALWGKVWEQGELGESRYAHMTKIEPMERALKELNAGAWISGIRRSQSKSRTDKPFTEHRDNILKAHPILDWTDEEVNQYIIKNDLPIHPLKQKGYVTSGDTHSTKPLQEVESIEETRFNGNKYECGLHLS